MKDKKHLPGFTIVELLVVISIIALLVGILVPAVQKARDSAKVTQSKSNLHQVMIALQTYASDHNDRNFTTAPDNLSSGPRLGMDISTAINSLQVANTYPMGIKLGEYDGNGYIYFIGMPGWCGAESGGVAPYCFEDGNTTSSTGKRGYGTWRYPNALQVAEYMEGKPLHDAYFSPKDTVPLTAIENCEDNSGSYCPTSAMNAVHSGADSIITSNMLGIPSSYCISPCLMYNPVVYQYYIEASMFPTDPMDSPRGFKPPTISQSKYPANKTWLMEHHWLQNLTANECSRRLSSMGTWFLDGDGCYDGCEPSHYNAHPDSEPVCVFVDGTVKTYMLNDFMIDSGLAEHDLPGPQRLGGLQIKNMSFDNENGYFADANEITDVRWTGHTHTKFGARGRDTISK